MSDSPIPALNLNDIQGFVLRGYHMQFTRHFVLSINDVAATKRLLAEAVNENSGFLQMTSAQPWPDGKPDYCLNIGLTYAGLKQLLDTRNVTFPGGIFRETYKEGAAAAAEIVGDTGQSAPDNWVGGLGTDAAQVVFSLYTITADELEKQTALLKAGFSKNDALALVHHFDGAAFADDKVHFGYRDGIAQPQIEGGPGKVLADAQLPVESWQFVLQQIDKSVGNNSDCTYTIKDGEEKSLLINGSFAAFRVLSQDVPAFDKYLNENAAQIPQETLAAKMCGRWRDGDPLVLDPDNQITVPPEERNNFEYLNADNKGYRCPVSSHIRRTNPRNQKVRGSADGKGSGVRNHRIIRRGMPYGPQYVPGTADDGIERGLLGLFICADLSNQFEFIMQDWVQASNFASGNPKGKDPLLGTNDPATSVFNIPNEDGSTLALKGFPQFITTRGGAYLFLPGLEGLKYIAEAATPSKVYSNKTRT